MCCGTCFSRCTFDRLNNLLVIAVRLTSFLNPLDHPRLGSFKLRRGTFLILCFLVFLDRLFRGDSWRYRIRVTSSQSI